FCAGLHVRGVSLVGVDVHGEFEIRVHAHQHVSENQFAVAPDPHAHKGFIADSITKRLFRTHVNVPQRADHSAVDLNTAFPTLQYATGRIRDVSAFADGRMNAELELFGHCDLDLCVFAHGSKNANTLNPTFRPNNRKLFLTGILTG